MSGERKEIRFSAFVQEASVRQQSISCNDLAPEVEYDANSNVLPYKQPRLKLCKRDLYRLLQPYVSVRFMEQCRAVIPLVIYLVLFQILVLHQNLTDPVVVISGIAAVMLGLMMFMEGLKLGLMPFGETIGTKLPEKAALPVVLLITLLLGIGVTFAEPAIGALKAAGSIVDVTQAPYLYTLLNDWANILVLVVGAGVGLAAVLGTVRLLYGWSLKPLIYMTITPILLLTVWFMLDPDLSTVLGLAWDCGAVTTGPVTVPLVLSLGIGIAAAAGVGKSPLAGFGVVTLASLFPIIAVMLLTLYVAGSTTPEEIIAAANHLSSATTSELAWYETSPFQEAIAGIRSIVPLIIFLLIVLRVILHERIKHIGIITYGISLCVLGMIIFNLGLTFGLAKIGAMAGSMLPTAFTVVDGINSMPIYSFATGIGIAVIFAYLLGFGATLAEPALNALGQTVETLTQGSFKKSLLLYSVSIGVGFGIMLGLLKITFAIPLGYLLIPFYIIALILTFLSSEEFVNVAWDSAGVTTGPVTVPLVLAMGLGLGIAVNAVEGFGILSMASICPIISVLSTGLWIQWKVNRQHKKADAINAIALKEQSS
ncbi:MAG: DUF1538 domain-containing protein [Mariprofundaceae bacterium]